MVAPSPAVPARPPLHLPANAVVDLHMHSPYSDGHWTPETLPAAAQELSLRVIALTDHDEIAGVPAMTAAAAAHGIHCIPGVEVSTQFQGTGFHLLLYNFDLDHPAIRGHFDAVRAFYDDMVGRALTTLAARGKALDLERAPLLATAGSRKVYHLVEALVVQGSAGNMSQAYGLCKEVGASYAWITPLEEALALAHTAGGLGVIAHPGRAEPGFTAAGRAHLDGMVAAGLDGVEAYHTFHRPEDVAFYVRYAEEKGLLVGCGSDTHGPGPSPRRLTPWPALFCRALLERCGVVLDPP